MQSSRAASDSRGGPGDRSGSKRIGALMDLSRGEPPPPSLTRIAQRGPENSRLAISKAQPSRIPQNPSVRKPATQSTSTRPPLTHEIRSWSTGSSSGRQTASPTIATGARIDGSKQSRNFLHRKQSGLTQDPTSLKNKARSDSGRTSSSSSVPRSQASIDPSISYSDRSITASPVEIRVAQKVELPQPTMQLPRVYPELDRYRDIQLPPSREGPGRDIPYRLTTEDLPPPTPLFSGASSHSQLSTFSASPSTRFSESPGPSPYSRDTTPTSISSQSPGLVAPMRLPTSRVRQASPAETRPPVTRRRAGSTSNESDAFSADPQGLAAVREALTSSSSGSTVRIEDMKEKKRARGRSPGPPNPPPRKSSQKFKKGQSVDEAPSPTKVSRIPALPVMRSVSPTKGTRPSFEKNSRPSYEKNPRPSYEKNPRPSYERVQDAASQSRPAVPSRPSRDGTPDLYSQFGGPVPIIHSNISTMSVTDKRHSSQLGLSSLSRSTTPSSTQDHSKSLRAPSREPTPAPSGNLTKSQPSKGETGRTTRTPSPGVSTFKSRFPLFGRRTKTAETTQTDKKEKVTRKGPAAGTGHEGYGRFGAVKRRSSVTSNLPRGFPGSLSPSENLANARSTDSFLLDRMNPVIIAGGEVVENRNTNPELTRTESNQSVPLSRQSVHSRNNSASSVSSREDRQTVWPSAFPHASARSRRPSDSSDSEAMPMKHTIAFRRSTRGLKSAVDLPKPIDTRGISSPSAASLATTILTDDSVPESRADPGHEQTERLAAPKKLTKKAKSPRKWNPFSRSQGASTPKKQVEASVSAAVQPAQSKPVAFYAMIDSSEQEDTEEPDVEAVFREAEDMNIQETSTADQQRLASISQPVQASQVYPSPHNIPIPETTQVHAPPVQTKSEPKLERQPAQTQTMTLGTRTGRPSRLPQVGRIPKVVNTRREQTSPKSFSRPFNRISFNAPPPQLGRMDQESVAKGPSPPRSFSPSPISDELQETKSVLSPPSLQVPQHPSLSPEASRIGNEFLAFSPEKSSGNTPSTESSNFGMARYSNYVAVQPDPTAPLGEDEIWDEYNDLLGDVPPSATSSRGFPFHLETYESGLGREPTRPLMSPTVKDQPSKNIRDSVETGKTLSSHYSADMTARLNAAFKFGSDQPSTPFSVSEFVSGYGDRNNSNLELEKSPNPSARHSSSSNQSAKTGASTKRSSGSSRNSEETPLSQVNLRVGSMTVSKWLTFGHVLFSPVREELLNSDDSPKRHSVLVIDGLGNDDWSFYAAETYPRATFYNLSPRAPLSQEQRSSSSFPLSPPNHHQIQFTSYANKFPFGPDSFTLVVFRFPPAAAESHYRNIISEACRVLKPGGFIELSILDVDLNNMGNRTRRSVRLLKERINSQDPNLNLSSTSDLALRLLNKKGFVDVKKCRVGVPVASSITSSLGDNKKKDERSLAEMMNDKTEMGDANITKMVSKVGRWWYNRCYEVPTGMSKSIWNDRALLAECEEWNTSLKLMVCHAKVPEARVRVASL
ncbi:hypothetical protein F5X99DRAFT_233498 [Biscogniauxia marginata]|nr:hypothetical protein F5X99DRAFT_233498 [Biscogniauxia marginata]